MLKKTFKTLGVFILILFWFLAGWPVIWQNPRIPPKVQKVQAAVSIITSGAINGATTNGGNVTLTFPAGVQQGDVVILYGGHPHRASSNLGPSTAGYIAVATHTAAAPNFGVWYKVMGTSPDSSVVGQGTGNTADATAYGAYILRGVGSSIFDQTTVTVGPTTSTNPNPGSITTQTNGAWVLALAGSQVNDASRGTITNYINLNGNTGNDNNDISVDGGTREIASAGAEDPPAWSTWSSGAWYAITIALKPNAPPNAPTQDSPTNGATGVSVTPTFLMTATDPDSDKLGYKVTIYSNSACTTVVQTNDQAVSATGWTGTNATCTASPTSCYTSGTQGSFLTQTALSNSTQYWWKASAKDPDGNGSFTDSSTCNSFTTVAAPVVSVSISDGVVTYGTMPANTSKTTLSGELNDTQTATNDGNVTETFNIKGQDATGGGCTWTLAATNGSDQYVHQFCNATDSSCTSPPTNYTALTTTYQTLKTGIAAAGTVNFHLRLTTPNPSSCFGQQSADVTIQAVQQ